MDIKCHVATNQEKYRSDFLKRKLELEKHFDKFFISSDIGHKKPDEEFFNHIMKTIENGFPVKRKNVLLVDDSTSNITSATNNYLKGHKFTTNKNFLYELREYLN